LNLTVLDITPHKIRIVLILPLVRINQRQLLVVEYIEQKGGCKLITLFQLIFLVAIISPRSKEATNGWRLHSTPEGDLPEWGIRWWVGFCSFIL
jgi:hypothetical protein